MQKLNQLNRRLSENLSTTSKILTVGVPLLLILTACAGGGSSSAAVALSEAPSRDASQANLSGGTIPKGEPLEEDYQETLQEVLVTTEMDPGMKAEPGIPSGGGGEQLAEPDIFDNKELPQSDVLSANPVEEMPVPTVDPSIPIGPQIGYQAPDFTLTSLTGDTIQLSGLLGKPVLISYWASWCVPCENELRILEQIQSEYQPGKFLVVAVNAIEQDSLDKVEDKVIQIGMSFPVLLDHNDRFAQMYGALFLPTTYYVDETGVIRAIRLGDSSEQEFRDKIQKLIAGEL